MAGFGYARYASPEVSAWSDGKELAFGLSFAAVIALSFLLALRLARSEPARA